jgi:hypothetical protein
VAETPQGPTVILGRARNGDEQALEELIVLIYSELRRVASRLMRRKRPDRTLPPTAVVHEALERPAKLAGRPPQVMILRSLGGSVMTVEQHWRLARVWLAGQLRGRDR